MAVLLERDAGFDLLSVWVRQVFNLLLATCSFFFILFYSAHDPLFLLLQELDVVDAVSLLLVVVASFVVLFPRRVFCSERCRDVSRQLVDLVGHLISLRLNIVLTFLHRFHFLAQAFYFSILLIDNLLYSAQLSV